MVEAHRSDVFAANESQIGTFSRIGPQTGSAAPYTAATPSAPASPSPSSASPSSSPTPRRSSTSTEKPTVNRSGGRPTEANTGVLPGTRLAVVNGNQTFGSKASGTTISNKDFRGYVKVTGSHITFRNCRFRGGSPNGTTALLDTSNSGGNITVTDSEFAPTKPAAGIDGLWLKNTTVSRVDVHGTVDGIKADSGSVIRDSYIHDMQWFASDPDQGGGETHNDAIQILNGSGITIDGDNLMPAGKDPNSAIQITQDFGRTSHVTITNNWADYGGCTFNFADKGAGSMSIGPVTGNRFGRHQGFDDCTILLGDNTSLVQSSGNVWADDGDPAPKPEQHN